MVGGLIEEEDISLLQHASGEGELHAPPSTEGGHGVLGLGLSVGVETDGGKDGGHFLAGAANGLDGIVVQDVVDAGQVGLLSLNVSLDEDGADLVGVGESLDLVLGDGPHEGGLARIVSAQKSVILSALQPHPGVVKENFGSVGEGEGAVAQLGG